MNNNPHNRKYLNQNHKTQSQKVLDSIKKHKLLFSVNQLQTPVFKQVHGIINNAIKQKVTKTKSCAKIPKFKYLQNQGKLLHDYCETDNVYVSPNQRPVRQRSMENGVLTKHITSPSTNPQTKKSQIRSKMVSKRSVMESNPRISEFGISKFQELDNIERIHEKLDAYIKTHNIY